MRKYLVLETFRSIVSQPPEEEGNVNMEREVDKSFASLTNLQYINNLSLAKLKLDLIIVFAVRFFVKLGKL